MKYIYLAAILAGTSHAFSASRINTSHSHSISTSSSSSSSSALSAKPKRGRLANNVSLGEDGSVKKILSNKQKQKLASSKSKRGKKAAISPLLAEWAKDDDDNDSDEVASTITSTTTAASTTASDTFVPFNDDDEDESSSAGMKKKKNGRKNNKKSSNKQKSNNLSLITAAQAAQMDDLLTDITDLLETNNFDTAQLVSNISSLVQLQSSFSGNDQILLPTLKSITSTKPKSIEEKQPAYRLAWVGSDDAICHIGTSLHKVPLARLQEMYLLLGYNRWELLEVIRILGPFPNVRNTLKGDLKLKKMGAGTDGGSREGVRLDVAYNSMIDGTGKEILAGKEDNVKNVSLNVWFANEKAMVCTVPKDDGEDGGGDDPLSSGNGSNILLFVAEENVDEELEKLRAA